MRGSVVSTTRNESGALIGMMIHQDGSTHEWVLGQKWDLIVTMDDATSKEFDFLLKKKAQPAAVRVYNR